MVMVSALPPNQRKQQPLYKVLQIIELELVGPKIFLSFHHIIEELDKTIMPGLGCRGQMVKKC